MLLNSENNSTREAVRKTFEEITSTKTEKADKLWRKTLHDGIYTIEDASEERAFLLFRGPGIPLKAEDYFPDRNSDNIIESNQLEITFHPSYALYDGRFANNSWLQEMPDPLTRLTWDNAAIFSPATAEKLGVVH